MSSLQRHVRGLATVAALGLAVGLNAQPVVLTTPNTNSIAGPVSVTLNGVTFVNLGLEGVGRIPASSLDQFGDTYGSASSMSIANWRKTRTGYSGTFNTLPDRGLDGGGFFSDYAARLQRVDFTFTPYVGSLSRQPTVRENRARASVDVTVLPGRR